MQTTFANRKLQKLCSDKAQPKSGLDNEQIQKLHLRLFQIAIADSLNDLYTYKELHCHELKGQRKNEYAINLDEKVRIVFIIADYPIPRLPDGGVNRKQVKEIEIIAVGDYH